MSSLAFLGLPIEFSGFSIYPPTLRDVVANNRFSIYCELLLATVESFEDQVVKPANDFRFPPDWVAPSPFRVLLGIAAESAEGEEIVREALQFFTKEDIIIFDLKRELIVIGDISKKIIEGFDTFPKIDEESYIDFQNVIRMAIGKELYEPPDPDMLPQIRRIKAMTRYRERVKGLGSTPLDLMTVLCCMGIGLTPLNVGEITYAAALYLQERHQLKEKYDIDIRVMTSGFGGEKPKDFQHWSLPPKKKK